MDETPQPQPPTGRKKIRLTKSEAYAMQLGVSAMSADEFRNVMLNGDVWRRFHGHGRHEAAMDSNPNIGETTERLTPFSDQATEPTAHTAQSGQSGQPGQGGAR